MLSEEEYVKRAHDELTQLLEAFDQLETESLEVELESDILTIEFPDGTKYVINSHRAARQIWMAAALSAWHFDFDDATGRWIAAKNGDELWATVERVLTQKLGAPAGLRSPE